MPLVASIVILFLLSKEKGVESLNDLLNQSGELRAVYKDMPEYQALREEDKRFFDNLFILLLFNEDKAYSNNYLSQRFNIPLSTLEKRIKRLARSKLIARKVSSELLNGKWVTTARTLELDPFTFSVLKKRVAAAKNKEDKVTKARTLAAEKNVKPRLPGESLEEHSIRTGAVEVLPSREKSFTELLEEIT